MLRHWKQQYRPNARFVFRRRTQYGGQVYNVGDEVPEALLNHKIRLRRFWDANRIELHESEPHKPKGKARRVPRDTEQEPGEDGQEAQGEAGTEPEGSEPPEPPEVDQEPETEPEADDTQESWPDGTQIESKGSWHYVTLPDGETRRVRGKRGLEELREALASGE